jgi:signal transduction histidine kinase
VTVAPAGSAPDRRRPFSTLRARLTLLSSAVVAAMLVVSALTLTTVQRRLLLDGVDEALKQRVDNVQVLVQEAGGTEVLADEGDREDSFVQLLDANGRVVSASQNMLAAPAAAPPPPPGVAEVRRTVSGVRISPHRFRVMVRRLQTDSGPRVLIVGKNLDDFEGSLQILTLSLAVLIPPIVILLVGMVWWVTGRALRPVEDIRAEVESMGGSQLDRRVQVPGTDDEIARLARTMNSMLDRLQRSTEQQRRFVADASHELRTPLTRLRSELELLVADPDRSGGDAQSLLADTVDLEHLVDDLLFLARSQSAPPDASAQVVDLDDLMLDEASRLRAGHRLVVDTVGVGPARVTGVPSELVRVVRNLVANAERHARSTVTMQSRECDGDSILVVSDDGPGIAAEHRAAVFERFTRLDEARSRDAGGAGLGLAIVRDIVARHGGAVSVTTSPAGGAEFTVTLPRVD